MKEMVGGCCVCSDERGWPDNPLVYCDGNGCTVAVHQACYGIVSVPSGPWYCRKCESPETKGKVKCELCPSKSGALKRTDTGGWAHVVCALYIPEVRFGNVTSMEPIVLRLIPPERYNKTCYICEDSGKTTHRASAGACMQCNKSGCKQRFHVTCAQGLGLLCEEAGNYLDNVKYCGYCQHHYSKLKKGGNVKTIPPYKPVPHDSHSSDSCGEKDGNASPMTSDSATPTHASKAKGPARKSSHSGSVGSSKNTLNSKTSNQTLDKKKPSPSRRGSSADGGSGSKTTTPAPSPQHTTTETTHGISNKAPGGSTPSGGSKGSSSSASPSANKSVEPVGVISSVASAMSSPAPIITSGTANTSATASVVQAPTNKVVAFSESVITNTEAVETKQTKKRKAMSAANIPNPPMDYIPTPPQIGINEANPQAASTAWDSSHLENEMGMDPTDKIIKKAKTETSESPMTPLFSNIAQIPPPPPPPPAHSPVSQPSPRHLPSPMPGPSGMSTGSNMRSPSQAAMEPSVPGHSPHAGRSSWGGLNVAYEMQQEATKPNITGVPATNKDQTRQDTTNVGQIPSTSIRNKRRVAMSTSVVSMSAPTQAPIHLEKPLIPKIESKVPISCTAPHMLGNELNPDSGAAARLQEQLSAELAAHATGSIGIDPLVPPPLINKAAPGTNSMGRASSSGAQSLDQLLERQWEQGSQFLMEQAQHFDIASLLSCLHQLRTENVRLEEHVGNLLQRRDHLLAVNARLAIPLNSVGGPPEPSRCPRENGAGLRAPPPPPRTETITSDRSHQLMMREVQQKPS